MHWKNIRNNLLPILAIFTFSLLVTYPLFRYSDIFRGNDLIANVSGFVYLKEIFATYGKVPQWNFYIGTGIPTMSDPLNSFFNPLIIVLYFIFDFVLATKYLLFILILGSALSFYSLCQHFKINRIISVLISMTYMCSGYLSARLVGGHLEKIIAYALIPLIYRSIFIWTQDKKKISAPITLGIIFGVFILSGSIYEFFYGSIVLATFFLYIIFESIRFKKKIWMDLLLFIFFFTISFGLICFWKIGPMIIYSSTISRSLSPFVGSQNLQSIINSFFFGNLNNPTFPNNIATYPYRWWESLAYIGPFPLLFIAYWHIQKNVFKYKILSICIEVVLITYSMINSPYNPFYWIVNHLSFLQNFRIPSRIFIYLVPLFLIIYAVVSDHIFTKFKHRIVILVVIVVNLFFVLKSFRYVYYQHNFPFVNKNFEPLLNYLNRYDSSYYYIAQDTLFDNQLPLYVAVKNHQKILNPTYGYVLKNYEYLSYANVDMNDAKKYDWIYPKYFLYSNRNPPKIFSYKPIKKIGDATLYMNLQYTPYVFITDLSNKKIIKINTMDSDISIKSVAIKLDEVIVVADSQRENSQIVILELRTKGWNAYIDGQKVEMSEGNYLSTATKKNKHTYSFKFLR